MKNVLRVFALIAFVAVIGFSIAACDNGSTSSSGQPNSGGSALRAPTGLTARAVSSTEIYVSWNPVAGAAGYYVYNGTSPSSLGYLWDESTTSFTNNNLPSNTTVYYQIAAYDAYGREGARSTIVSARTQGGVNVSSIEGTWQSGSGARITVNGNTGKFSAFGTWALHQSALNQGFVRIGSEAWRNISSTGNLTWSCEILLFSYKSSSPNVCTGVSWEKGSTLTLSADGRTLSAYAPGANTPSSTYTRYQ